MSYKSILILGGYGNAGRLIAKLLLKQTNLNIVIAGRNVERARILADLLNQKFPGKRVSAKRVDAADYQNLQNTFAQVDLVVVASATIDYVENVARAAMAARIDYLDTQLSTPRKIETLRSLEADMIKNGCCFITDGGFHPGLPAALIRHAAQRFDYLEEAKVGSLIRMNWKELSFSESTIRGIFGFRSLRISGQLSLKMASG
ncbi:MAG: saccharopine dehydrogenase NADP-binding domain-containing protein [Calditrichia bacterium]